MTPVLGANGDVTLTVVGNNFVDAVNSPGFSVSDTRVGFKMGDYPVTDDVFARTLTLPLHPAISAEDQETVVNRLLADL